MGWALYHYGKYIAAETYLRRALERAPGHPVIIDHIKAVESRLSK